MTVGAAVAGVPSIGEQPAAERVGVPALIRRNARLLTAAQAFNGT